MRIHRAVGSRRKGLMGPLDFSRSVNPVNQVGRCRLCSPHYYLDLQDFQTFLRLWDISRYCFVLLITIFIRGKSWWNMKHIAFTLGHSLKAFIFNMRLIFYFRPSVLRKIASSDLRGHTLNSRTRPKVLISSIKWTKDLKNLTLELNPIFFYIFQLTHFFPYLIIHLPTLPTPQMNGPPSSKKFGTLVS